ncbi:MAG TPA: hypothetical protein VEM32_02870, partial [Geobacteraceae bacterium]|nr:hypothetical protein [Geobacteraceae bacterium]
MVCNHATSNKMLWQSLRIMLVAMIVGLAGPAWATLSPVTWTEQTDFENNAVTTGTPTTRINIDTSTTPGDVKIGITKDLLSTAAITCTATNKIYTIGSDRASVAVI